MRKNYLVFPAGRFGVALLLLRASAAASLLAGMGFCGAPLPLWADLALVCLSGGLLAGLCTRLVAAATAAVLAVVSLCIGGVLGAAAALHGLDAAALAMLGAGAYSLDSRLFGRRVITLDS